MCQQGFTACHPMNIGPTKGARPLCKLVPNPKARLQDQFHEVARFKYLAERTEASYWQWVVRYLKFQTRSRQRKGDTGDNE